MLGVKVELNAQSVAEVKTKFGSLLTSLQDRANKTAIKINVDLGNMRQVNGILNNVISDLGRLDAQNKRTSATMAQISGTMREMATTQNQVNNGSNNGHENNFGFGTLAGWLLLRKGIQLAMTELREGLTFALDMNKAMTEISIVTGMSQAEVGKLATQYNVLAKSMAVSTEEIAKASVEYYRQGLTTNEVNERMKQTIQYAKVSGMALDEASTILTATVNSMDIDIKRASDVFAYMGDATATGADEIGRAFQKVGGTASALGVNFEKVSSWIATVSSKTREGAETIGNSMKNLMARFQQLREKGFAEEDGTQVNQVSKSLNEVGINIMNAEGQFRNFGTVMDELGQKWSGLDNRHKAYIATTLAGTNQQSRFLNLMENYGDSVDLYNKSLDSAGTTQQKYSLYLQGTEAHINQLKATAEGMWLKVFNSSDMRDGIDEMTKLVGGLANLIDKFGAIPTVLATATGAFLAFNKNVKLANLTPNINENTNVMTGISFNGGAISRFIGEYKSNLSQLRLGMAEVTKSQMVFTESTTTLGTKFRALTATTIGQTVATGALEIATLALNAVIGFSIGIAITGLIAGISHLANATKEARDNAEKLTESYRQSSQDINGNIQTISGLKKEYDELKDKTNLTADETKKLHDIQNQIAQISPDVVDGYDSQGNAMLKLGTNLDSVIEKLKEKNRLEAVKMVNGFDDAKKVYNTDKGNAQKELEKLEKQLSVVNTGGSVGDNNYSYQARGLTEVKNRMAELAKQGKENTFEFKNLAKSEVDLEEKAEKLNRQIEEQRGKLSEAKNVIDPFRESMLLTSKGYDSLSDGAKRLAKDLADGISPDNLSLTQVQKIVDKLSGSDMQKATESLDKLKLNKDKMGTSEYNSELIKILDTIHEITGVPIEKLRKFFDASDIQETTRALTDAKQAMQEYTSQFDGATNKIADYNKFIDEMNDKNTLSATSVKAIMEKYPELLQYLGNEADLRVKLAELTANEEEVQKSAYTNMLLMSEEFYNNKVRGNQQLTDELMKAYGVDLNNCKTLAEAKQQVELQLIQNLAKNWSAYYSMQADGSATARNIYSIGQAQSLEQQGFFRELDAYNAKAKEVASRFNNITASLSPVNFNKINMSKTTSGGSSGSGSSTSYESKLDGMDKFTAYLDDINNQLEKQDDLISDVADKAKLYKEAGDRGSLLKALELETQQYTEQARKLATLKQDTGLVNSQMTVLAQTFKKNWGAMSGADLSSWSRTDFNKMFEQLFPTKTFSNKSSQEAYDNQKKYFSTLVDDWFKYSDEIKKINNDILSTQNDMVSLMQQRYETYFSVINGDLDKLTSGIDDVRYSMDMLGESENFNEREQLTQKLIAKTTTYRDTIQNAITTLTTHKGTLQEGSAEWTVVNTQIKEYEKTLQDANKQLKDASDLIQQIQQQELDTASGLQDKIVDALKSKYNKAKEAELKVIEDKKQQDIDKANGELDKLKDELKALQDETQDKKDQLAKEKAELELWKKDNSAYAQGKVKELEADIKKREKELSIDAKQKEIDDKQAEIDTINKNAETETKVVEDKYKLLLDDQALYAEALKIMTTQSQEDILALLQSYDEKYSQLGTTLGKAYSDALKVEIQKGMDALKAMQDGMAGAITPETPTTTPTPPSTPATPPPIAPPATPPAPSQSPSGGSIAWDGKYYQKGSSGEVVKRIQQNLNANGYNLAVDGIFGTQTRNAVVDFQRKNGLGVDGIIGNNTWGRLIKFDTGGYTGDFGGGRLAVLHQKERVLNASQTKAFEYLIYDILPKFYNQTAMSKLDSMASVIFNEPVVKNDIRIVNNTPFDVDNNMDNLNKAIKQELRQAGFRINLVR